jgi:hypothetical protein
MKDIERSVDTLRPPSSWRVARLAMIWLFGCSLAGLIIAMINGEFGSIVYVIVGVFVGLSGALSHCLLVRRASFRRRSKVTKAMFVWVGAMIIPLAWTVVGALDSNAKVSGDYVFIFGGGIAVFALVASICITAYDARRSVLPTRALTDRARRPACRRPTTRKSQRLLPSHRTHVPQRARCCPRGGSLHPASVRAMTRDVSLGTRLIRHRIPRHLSLSVRR